MISSIYFYIRTIHEKKDAMKNGKKDVFKLSGCILLDSKDNSNISTNPRFCLCHPGNL